MKINKTILFFLIILINHGTLANSQSKSNDSTYKQYLTIFQCLWGQAGGVGKLDNIDKDGSNSMDDNRVTSVGITLYGNDWILNGMKNSKNNNTQWLNEFNKVIYGESNQPTNKCD